jgi:tetratricopeptide (TPR) repeat protein
MYNCGPRNHNENPSFSAMRQATCSQCGLTTTVRSFYTMGGKNYCEPCVWKAAREAREAGQPGEYTPLQDNSICQRCGSYSGDNADHPIVGNLALCSTCAATISNWPYPQWLKVSLAVLLLLLVVALVHGRRYFHAGRTMYIGERLVEEQQYEQALPYLKETLKIAPESDKAVLLTAKAALEIGDMDTADKAIQGHSGGHFDDADDHDFQEVKAMWDRATAAFEKAAEAAELEQQEGHAAEAAQLKHQAAELYPQGRGLAGLAETFDEGSAFEAKDYNRYLSIAQKAWEQYPSASTAAAYSSALACKYAVAGDPSYRQQSEWMLEVARQKTGSDASQMKAFQEYADRIRHRLESRQIITKAEYDRKFRKQAAQ